MKITVNHDTLGVGVYLSTKREYKVIKYIAAFGMTKSSEYIIEDDEGDIIALDDSECEVIEDEG